MNLPNHKLQQTLDTLTGEAEAAAKSIEHDYKLAIIEMMIHDRTRYVRHIDNLFQYGHVDLAFNVTSDFLVPVVNDPHSIEDVLGVYKKHVRDAAPQEIDAAINDYLTDLRKDSDAYEIRGYPL